MKLLPPYDLLVVKYNLYLIDYGPIGIIGTKIGVYYIVVKFNSKTSTLTISENQARADYSYDPDELQSIALHLSISIAIMIYSDAELSAY